MGDEITRRKVLEVAGAGGIGTAVSVGTATGDSDDSPTEYIVGLEPGRTETAVDRAEEVKQSMDFGEIGEAVVGQFSEETLTELEADSRVRYIEENGRVYALNETTPYGIELIDADTAIDLGKTGEGVDVAIIDSGIDVQHETLEPNLGEGWAASGAACGEADGCPSNDIDECLEPWDDDNDHGTHVAGTAAAAMNGVGVLGVAPDATVHAVKVLDCSGGGGWANVADGVKWAADQGHDVINMSLGADTDSQVIGDSLDYAASQGVVIVASAGNDGNKDNCDDEDCVGHPADHPEVIAVSAVDGNDILASFSSIGPEIDIAAPGVGTDSSIPRDEYASFSGTSMASPHVAGAAATLIADGTTDREAVRQQLQDSAEDVGLDDNEQGNGRLDVASAVGIEIEATFTVDPEEPLVDEEVTFDASESFSPNGDIVEYQWDFTGDGQADQTVADPVTTHTYDEGGSYTVTLVVEDETGETETESQQLSVSDPDPPVASFTVSPEEPFEGEQVTFDASDSSASDGDIVEYEWDFDGDGVIDETTSSPEMTHTYDEADVYTATLTVVDEFGQTDTDSVEINVSELDDPTATFTVAPDEPLVGEAVTLDASDSSSPNGDIERFQWDFDGDGGIDETTTDPETTHTYDDPGDYTPTLTVVDEFDQTATTTTTVNVEATVESYADDDGAVQISGIRRAVRHWQNGDIDSGLLSNVIEVWSSGG